MLGSAGPSRTDMHANSKLIFEKYATSYFPPGTRVLEIGPDGFPSAYRSKVNRGSLSWDTLDIYKHPSLTHVGLVGIFVSSS